MSTADNEARGSRTDEVHRFLTAAIERGDYATGSQLPSENALALRLEVSRPVVREAVSRLAAEGLVQVERGRGTFVRERKVVRQLHFPPIDGVSDLLAWQDLRIAVEQETARLAAERHSAEDLERLHGIHDRLLDRARAGERAIDLDFEFHLAIAQATQNPILCDAQRSLGDHIRAWMTTMLERTSRSAIERHELRNREHQAILDAIERRDPEAAFAAARRHIEYGRTRLLVELTTKP